MRAMDRPISSAVLAQVQEAVFSGRKLEAIKLYRIDTGASLKDAKEAVDKLEAEWRVVSPEKFKARQSKKGCCGIVVAIILVLHIAGILFLVLSQRANKVFLEGKGGKPAAGVQK